jgi:hypothetical protein
MKITNIENLDCPFLKFFEKEMPPNPKIGRLNYCCSGSVALWRGLRSFVKNRQKYCSIYAIRMWHNRQ